MKNKLISGLLLCSMVASSFAMPVYGGVMTQEGAADVPVELTQNATTFSVTVPTSLPVNVDGTGTVTVSTNNKIVNNSFGPIEVKSVEVQPQNDWEIVDFDTNFKSLKVGSKQFGFKINDVEVELDGGCSATFPIVYGKSETSFTYDADIAPQTSEITREAIANVVFTVGWYSEGGISGGSGDSGDLVLYGGGQTYHKMAPSSLSFRSTAPLDEFQEVLINGEVVDSSNYTLTEGSTIVTLDIDYLDSLDIDDYEITVVSDSGSPSTDFEVITAEQSGTGKFLYYQPYYGSDNNVFFICENNIVISLYLDTLTFEKNELVCEDGIYTVPFTTHFYSGYFSDDGLTFIGTELRVWSGGLSPSEYYDGVDFNIRGENNETVLSDGVYVYVSEGHTYTAVPLSTERSSYPLIKSNILNKPVNKIDAFYNNINLRVFDAMPNSITEIAGATFYECTNLQKIVIPKSVTKIRSYAFFNCINLTNIAFEGTKEEWNNIYLEIAWNVDCNEIMVTCSDGTVIIPANL